MSAHIASHPLGEVEGSRVGAGQDKSGVDSGHRDGVGRTAGQKQKHDCSASHNDN
jgi:hypothetical protein